MKVLITGATGLIGTEIVKCCHDKGWTVHYLTRSRDDLKSQPNYRGFHWDIENNQIDIKCFEGVDTIINLAGATIAKRWTENYKKTIVKSRVQSLELLKESIKMHNISINHIVSASAIGVYNDSLTNFYNETSEDLSSSFLGETVKKWEESVDEFKSLGTKVAKIRIGLVLSNKGGALVEMTKPIKIGLGAALGSGKQWQSWIHINDLARIFVYVGENKLIGIYNAVAPNPVINQTLTTEIAEVLDKPLVLPNIPRFLLKVILGEMHILLFDSQRVSSEKIQSKGFQFKFPNLKPALKHILK